MSPLLPTQPRRQDVDRLAALLEADPADRIDPSADDAVLAQLAEALRSMAADVPPMREEFRAELRAEVVEAAREQRPGRPLLGRLRDGARRARYSTAAVTGMGVAGTALSGGGVALAAEHAQPDDLLYDVKLALEDLRLALTSDDVARGERGLTYAFERLEEARAAAGRGDDDGAATALRDAAGRVEAGGDLLVGSGLVDPVIDLAGDLSAQVALLESLRPQLGDAGSEAADALLAVIVATTEDILEVIDPADWPDGEVPRLPALPVPEQSATPTATPDPTPTGASSTPSADPTPTPSASATPLPPGASGGDQPALPGVPLPDGSGTASPGTPALPGTLPLPGDPSLPGDPGLPTGPRPGASNPLPDVGDAVEDAVDEVQGGVTDGLDEVIDGVGGAVDEVIDGVGGAVDGVGGAVDGVGDGVEDVLDGVTDAVPDPVPSALPHPVPSVVEEVPSIVEDVIDVVPDVVETVPDVIDGVGDAVDDTLGGLLGD